VSARVLAPFGARTAGVVARRETGGYVVFTALDPEGPDPAPGQFYMLRADGWGAHAGRPFLPRAFSVAAAERTGDGVRLEFLVEAVGPGTSILAALEPGARLEITGPLGRAFSEPHEVNPGAPGAIMVGGGIGIAPIAILRRHLTVRAIPARTLLGFRDRAHSGGLELFGACQEVGLAFEDGHRGHQGYVTDLLQVALKGDDAAASAVYACGPPAMLEAVRAICAERGARAELAMEAPMACGYGACFGCAVPRAEGGYMRLCVDGPVVRADEIETALVAGSGHR
jgi:dihydroorotate dehydrogenase electron transfer subunit